jgi:hypothetical protein
MIRLNVHRTPAKSAAASPRQLAPMEARERQSGVCFRLARRVAVLQHLAGVAVLQHLAAGCLTGAIRFSVVATFERSLDERTKCPGSASD